MSDWRERCDWCGWPLKQDVSEGCVASNCSMRPMPELSEIGQRQQEIRKLERKVTALQERCERLEWALQKIATLQVQVGSGISVLQEPWSADIAKEALAGVKP